MHINRAICHRIFREHLRRLAFARFRIKNTLHIFESINDSDQTANTHTHTLTHPHHDGANKNTQQQTQTRTKASTEWLQNELWEPFDMSHSSISFSFFSHFYLCCVIVVVAVRLI